MLRTFVIRPDGTWFDFSHPAEIPYVWLRDQLGGWIEAVYGDGYVAWVDEEGKLKRLPANPVAEAFMRSHGCHLMAGDYIVGPVVFSGGADPEGETTGVPAQVAAELLAYLAISSAH
jgi:hypothetical protein